MHDGNNFSVGRGRAPRRADDVANQSIDAPPSARLQAPSRASVHAEGGNMCGRYALALVCCTAPSQKSRD